jgi:hypothetical protein
MDIKLACGKIAQIDEEDIILFEGRRTWKAHFDGLNWYVRRFTFINKKSKTIYLHREIMGVTDRKILIDHIDGNGLNNQKSNLRTCTHAQNRQNSRVNKSDKKSSKYKGITLIKYKVKCREGGFEIRKRWEARINHNKKRTYIGAFSTEIEAALAYNKKAIEYHGEFACLNEI